MQYEQLLLDKNLDNRNIMVSKKNLRMETQKSPIQKAYETNVGADLPIFRFNLLINNKQFDWLEFLLVYYKSEQHTTISNSYNFELAAKTIKSIKPSNFTASLIKRNLVLII